MSARPHRGAVPFVPRGDGTGDQLYGEFDFEAYRQLGWSVTKEALDGDADPDARVPAPRTPAEGSVPGASSP